MRRLSLLAAFPFALAGCQTEAPLAPEKPAVPKRSGIECRMGPLTAAIGKKWSCYPVTSKGIDGIGLFPLDHKMPIGIMLSTPFPLAEGTTLKEKDWEKKLATERAGFAPQYKGRKLSKPRSEVRGDLLLVYVEGDSVKYKGLVKRQGYAVVARYATRFVEYFPKASKPSYEGGAMWKTIRFEGGGIPR